MTTLNLRTKFVLGMVGLALFMGLSQIVFLRTALHDRLFTELQKRGISIAKHFAEVAATPVLTERPIHLQLQMSGYMKSEPDISYLFVTGKKNEVIAHTFTDGFPADLLTVNRLEREQPFNIQQLETEKGTILDIAAPILRGDLGTVHVGISAQAINDSIGRILGFGTGFIIVILVIAGGCTILFATAITRPIMALTRGVQAVGNGELNRRISISSGDEIGQLAQSFNRMAESLQFSTVSKEYMDRLINTMNDAIIVLSPDKRVVMVNRAFTDLTGWEAQEIGKRSAFLFLQPSSINPEGDLFARLGQAGFVAGVETSFAAKDGRLVPVLCSIATMFADDGGVKEFICAAQNITTLKLAREAIQTKHQELKELNRNLEATVQQRTEQLARINGELTAEIAQRKRVEEELLVAKNTAESANQAKSRFLGIMSHEIRTPLNALMGVSELLNETRLTREQKQYVGILQRSGTNLLLLINDILDLSKVEAGLLTIDAIEFDLGELLTRTMEMMTVRAQEKGLQLTCQCSADIPNMLVGDPNRLRQVLVNLVGNAIKFTEHGSVSVAVAAADWDEHHLTLLFSVADTGIGIPEEKLDSIFESFTQGDASITRNYGGTGLGLSISKKLVTLMGGDIRVESRTGRGSTFHFRVPVNSATIPAAAGAAAPQPADIAAAVDPPAGDQPQIKILLVEDAPDSRLLIGTILKKANCSIEEACNGVEAVEKFRSARYDLVLMDMQMPVMDGYRATRELRRHEEVNRLPRTPIIALTAFAFKADVQKSLTAGCDSHISKPLKKAALLAAVQQFTGRRI